MPITDVFKQKNNFAKWQVRGGKFTLACNNLNEVQFAKAWLIYNYDFTESEIEILETNNKRGVTEFRVVDEYAIANFERKNPESVEEETSDSPAEEQQEEEQSRMAQALKQKLDEKRRNKNGQSNKENCD